MGSSSVTLHGDVNAVRVVRFDDQCAVIPEVRSSRISRLFSLSPSFPQPPHGNTISNPTDKTTGQAISPNNNRQSFISRLSKKTSLRLSSPHLPLSIADSSGPTRRARYNTAPSSSSRKRHRMSLPLLGNWIPQNMGYTKVPMLPLRQCCLDCHHVTDTCLASGDDWCEQFTRAARNRRRASVDYQTILRDQRMSGEVTPEPPTKPGHSLSDTVDDTDEHSGDASSHADGEDSSEYSSDFEPTPTSVEFLKDDVKFDWAALNSSNEFEWGPSPPPSPTPSRTPSPEPPIIRIEAPSKRRTRILSGVFIVRMGIDFVKGFGSFGPQGF